MRDKIVELILTDSVDGEKIVNNNGFGSVFSRLIRTSFFAVLSLFISFKECL